MVQLPMTQAACEQGRWLFRRVSRGISLLKAGIPFRHGIWRFPKMKHGSLNVPFWEYWTSPYSSHYRPYTIHGWVMWKMGHLMTHVWRLPPNHPWSEGSRMVQETPAWCKSIMTSNSVAGYPRLAILGMDSMDSYPPGVGSKFLGHSQRNGRAAIFQMLMWEIVPKKCNRAKSVP